MLLCYLNVKQNVRVMAECECAIKYEASSDDGRAGRGRKRSKNTEGIIKKLIFAENLKDIQLNLELKYASL